MIRVNRDSLLLVAIFVKDVDDGPRQRVDDHLRSEAPQLAVQLLVIRDPEAPLTVHRVVPGIIKIGK